MACLIFTVAQNGYDIGFSQCIRSQAAYAERLGHVYALVRRPFRVSEPALSAWLKIPLMLRALHSGYEWVAFIDADCRVRDNAPDFREVAMLGKSVYMAHGRSGRVNSGVMFARAESSATDFFGAVLASLTAEIPHEDRKQLKYENGNVIHCARGNTSIGVMDPRWNNTSDPALPDFFRHYTGPLRDEYRRSFLSTCGFRLARAITRPPVAQPESRDAAFVSRLEALSRKSCRLYPQFMSAPSEALTHAD
jgi:hypothetical protein